jgi:hypothetical protein
MSVTLQFAINPASQLQTEPGGVVQTNVPVAPP